MRTVAGIFSSREEALQAADRLREYGVPDGDISVLHPGASKDELLGKAAEDETEGKGTGTVLGGIVGASAGIATGPLIASIFVPGVGIISALGVAAMGIIGAVAGAAAGNALEHTAAYDFPEEELHVYEHALRNGKTVLVTVVADDQIQQTEALLEQAGATGINRARDEWWIGQRTTEKLHYEASGGKQFLENEPMYRQGFETALNPKYRGKQFAEVKGYLEEHNPECRGNDCFRQGYERGQEYHKEWQEKIRTNGNNGNS